MNLFIIILLFAGYVVADYFWIDQQSKRWSWFKNMKPVQKMLVVSAILVVLVLTYLGADMEYFS
ncbi:hypothetical protein IM538_02925 [Cytobacillus suaedae]|nr:hypothetical protein IM538_02925 [Cytobacillus suaedae]